MESSAEPRIGIALGGGGAKGLAHIALLGVLDELNVRPAAIAGTSIGAIIGSMYAAGMTAAEIRTAVDDFIDMPSTFEEFRNSKRSFGWLDLLSLEFGRSHLLQADAFLTELGRLIQVTEFDQLQIPLQVVAADFWARQQVVFDSGSIIRAVEASFALPGVFRPVVIDEAVLVDGGCVNPVPFDLLATHCDIVVEIDVLGKRMPQDDLMPSYTEALFNTFQIAEKTIVEQKRSAWPPDIYIEPGIQNVKVLEFQKSAEIYAACAPDYELLKRELEDKISHWHEPA